MSVYDMDLWSLCIDGLYNKFTLPAFSSSGLMYVNAYTPY